MDFLETVPGAIDVYFPVTYNSPPISKIGLLHAILYQILSLVPFVDTSKCGHLFALPWDLFNQGVWAFVCIAAGCWGAMAGATMGLNLATRPKYAMAVVYVALALLACCKAAEDSRYIKCGGYDG